jgi:hypothetical protein
MLFMYLRSNFPRSCFLAAGLFILVSGYRTTHLSKQTQMQRSYCLLRLTDHAEFNETVCFQQILVYSDH